MENIWKEAVRFEKSTNFAIVRDESDNIVGMAFEESTLPLGVFNKDMYSIVSKDSDNLTDEQVESLKSWSIIKFK